MRASYEDIRIQRPFLVFSSTTFWSIPPLLLPTGVIVAVRREVHCPTTAHTGESNNPTQPILTVYTRVPMLVSRKKMGYQYFFRNQW